MGVLEKIDYYGVKCQMRVYGKETFGTWLGGALTLLTVMLTGMFGFLLGTDMWFKQNPQVVTSQFMPEKTEIIYPASNNFTIAYRVEDVSGNIIDSEKFGSIFTPVVHYIHLKKNKDRQWEVKIRSTKTLSFCNETKTAENTDTQYLNLDTFYCVNWELIKKEGKEANGEDYKVVLGGSWEEDEVGYLTIQVGNPIRTDNEEEELASRAEIIKLIGSENYYFSMFYPESFFDPTDLNKPLKSYLKNYFSLIDPEVGRTDRFFFQESIVNDDTGWLFENKSTVRNFTKSREELEFRINEKTAETVPEVYYSAILYLDKPKTIFNRRFMKIQELAALLGGFIKGVQVLFGIVSRTFGKYKKTLFIAKKLAEVKGRNLSITSKSQSDLVNNYVKMKPKYGSQKNQISFFNYVFGRLLENKTDYESFVNTEKKIEQHQDIKMILDFSRKLDEFEKNVKQQD